MRSFNTLRTASLSALLIAVPFTGACAASAFYGPETGLMNQAQGVDEGIAEARQQSMITPAEAQNLHMRAAHIERTAAAARGRISATQYQQLLRQLDDVDQTLRVDSGTGFLIGDGADGGHYPNG
jgi:hypothetical protein